MHQNVALVPQSVKLRLLSPFGLALLLTADLEDNTSEGKS